jgi:acetylornithine deacetylase/succinyl-diaminopimelate desuccinylase-like protein
MCVVLEYAESNMRRSMEFPASLFADWFAKNQESIYRDFTQFLGFRSISTDPSCKKECEKAAHFLSSYLQDMGMQVELFSSSGLPAVFAETKGKDHPSVLFYHHYDVQPVDPLDLWKGDPFMARREEGKIFARGASDNKGQCFITLTALKALQSMGYDLPLQIKLFIEGEEESGGAGTGEILCKEKEKLRADNLCVVDFDLISEDTPAVAMGYRGLVALYVECSNADTDLHSGVHGGIALNPIRVLSELIAKFWDENGKIALAHFYDGIEELSKEDREKIADLFDEEKYREEFGVKAFSREEGVKIQEAAWLRPTIEVNGIFGGYTGDGFKTVIPAKANAKISCRLVPGQNPQKIAEIVADFLQKNAPEGVKVETKWHHGAGAFRVPFGSHLVSAVSSSMQEVFLKPCLYTLCGGSIPIVQDLAKVAGGDVALFGFALATDNIHAPNEHFRLECFKKGFFVILRLLWRLAHEKK